VRVELVHDQIPLRIRMQHDGTFAVFQEVFLGTRGTHCGRHRFATDHIEAGDQAQRAVADVFELDEFFLAGPHLFLGAIRSRA
jgi:hypothetical protein